MKKSIVIIIVFSALLIFANSANAVSIDLKEKYERKETVIVKIAGNIQEPISKSQLEVKRNNVLIPVEYDIKNLNGTYYIWLITPDNPGNYTLIIKGVNSIVSGVPEKKDIAQNFSVSSNESDYNVRPGAVISQDEFEFIIQLNEDLPKNIQINYLDKSDLQVQPGKNVLSFDTKRLYGTEFLMIGIGKYKIPAYLTGHAEKPISREPVFINPAEIRDIRLISEKNIFYEFYIANRGEEQIKNIYMQYNKDVFSIKPDEKISLGPGERAYYNITLKAKESGVRDIVYIKSGKSNFSLSMPVEISFVKNVSELIANKSFGISNKSMLKCSEFSGKVCSASQSCLGDKIESSEGICCIGECKSSEEGSKGWLGYLIASFVIIGIFYIFFKFYRKKNS